MATRQMIEPNEKAKTTTATLTLVISGLCVMVPRDVDGALWVLMPKSGGHHKHAPVLVYDGAFEQPPTTGLVVLPVDGALVRFDGTGSADLRQELARFGGNISSVHKVGPDDDWFEDELQGLPAAKLQARARLTGVASITPGNTSTEWTYDNKLITMFTEASCEIPLSDRCFSITLASGSVKRFCTIDGVMFAKLLHVPADEIPPATDKEHRCPNPGAKPEHWHLFRHMFDVDPGDTREPQLVRCLPEGQAAPTGINPYACMTIPGCTSGDPNCP